MRRKRNVKELEMSENVNLKRREIGQKENEIERLL